TAKPRMAMPATAYPRRLKPMAAVTMWLSGMSRMAGELYHRLSLRQPLGRLCDPFGAKRSRRPGAPLSLFYGPACAVRAGMERDAISAISLLRIARPNDLK